MSDLFANLADRRAIIDRRALAGAGAFGEKHLDGLKYVDGVTVTSVNIVRTGPGRVDAALVLRAP